MEFELRYCQIVIILEGKKENVDYVLKIKQEVTRSRQFIIRNDMQLAYYPTRPLFLLERDCTCESQLFPFCHAGLNMNY